MSDMPERIWLQGGVNNYDFAAYRIKKHAMDDWETDPTAYVRADLYYKLVDTLQEIQDSHEAALNKLEHE